MEVPTRGPVVSGRAAVIGRNGMKSTRNQKGFTLIELIIVIGITIILAAGAFTGFYQYTARTRVKTAIRNIIILKKAVNSMASVCKGFPKRDTADNLDSFLEIVDLTECKGNARSTTDAAPTVYPTDAKCNTDSIGNEILQALPGSTAGKYKSSTTLCLSACDYDDKDCISRTGANFYHAFITDGRVPEPLGLCSPKYGAISGPAFGPGQYQPGWNYALLDPSKSGGGTEVDKPVGVICGMALGYKTTVIIVVNTSGFYKSQDCGGRQPGEVPEGVGCYDLEGNGLTNKCKCGPWCRETNTGRQGCCAPCEDQPGIGYKY
jgi:prepilin-type N-terminal cleavage/methylation domain-containing protein